MPICFGNNQADLYNTNASKLNKTLRTMEKNTARLKRLPRAN